MDEQKQIILLATPVMTQERFAQLTGLTEGLLRGMIEKGHLPSVKIGKPRLVNIALISQCSGQLIPASTTLLDWLWSLAPGSRKRKV